MELKWSLLGRLLIAEERVDGSIFLMFLSVMERDGAGYVDFKK